MGGLRGGRLGRRLGRGGLGGRLRLLRRRVRRGSSAYRCGGRSGGRGCLRLLGLATRAGKTRDERQNEYQRDQETKLRKSRPHNHSF
ncbi:MAG: hypothetical protein FJ319_09430 [SAR202 cluster bacterium]|nr:hypothetical protein [SAR202 cluster bacterium]